jgi:phospholipase/lecithinase/hemolysin
LLPVYLEALVHAPRREALRRAVSDLLEQVQTFLRTQIDELVGTDFLPQWVDPESMAALLIASADGLALHAALDPKAVDQGAVAGQVIQLLLAARSSV